MNTKKRKKGCSSNTSKNMKCEGKVKKLKIGASFPRYTITFPHPFQTIGG